MTDGFHFEIKGGKELDAALKKLGIDLERKVAKSAVRAGANVVAKEARRLVRVGKTGILRRSIRVISRSRRQGDAVASVITRSGKKFQATKSDGWYAHFLEFGTIHNAARPFMRPAVDGKKAEAIQAMADKIAERIAKLANPVKR